MASSFPQPSRAISDRLRDGVVIPAHPLALTSQRRLDERRQQALSRYYLASGAGGLAVGVHTTQFAIREPQHNLLAPVLELGAAVAAEFVANSSDKKPIILVAGLCGNTEQAIGEARLATQLGYHIGLLSLAALKDASEDELIKHAENVAREMPIFGFYLQPAVGGRVLPFSFWQRFVEIPNVVAIKVAAFNRYQTLDVMRAVAASDRRDQIAMVTGNDDNIVVDLLSEYTFPAARAELQPLSISFVGGLLGHWACWTHAAVGLLQRCQVARDSGSADELRELLRIGHQVTDMNAAIFDAAHNYSGCIAGVHEVLRRQGLLEGIWCLDEDERLSPGQSEEISRVCDSYPHLMDDAFVAENLDRWLDGGWHLS